jgi:PAS domain-containing protein
MTVESMKLLEEQLAYCPRDITNRAKRTQWAQLCLMVLMPVVLFSIWWLVTQHTRSVHAKAIEAQQTDEMLSASSVGRWSLDMTTQVLTWDEPMKQLFKRPDVPFNGRYQDFLDCVAVEDRGWVDGACRSAMEEGGQYRAVYRLSTGVYIRALGKMVKLSTGQKIFAGICMPAKPADYTGRPITYVHQLSASTVLANAQ